MTDRKTAIHEAALKLDHSNDDHWTKGGDPALDDLKALTGLDDLTRSEVNEATYIRRGEVVEVTFSEPTAQPSPNDLDGIGLMTRMANDPEVQEIMLGLIAAGRTEYHFSETKDVTVIQFTAPDGTPMKFEDDIIQVDRAAYAAIIAERDELKAALVSNAEAQKLHAELNPLSGNDDAIALLEAFVKASGHERYRRNSQIQAIAQSYRVQQKQIKEHQDRIDKREADRVAARQTAQG